MPWKDPVKRKEYDTRYEASKTALCTVEGCDATFYRRTWCVRHYTRWKRYGDPLYIQKEWRPREPVIDGKKLCRLCQLVKSCEQFAPHTGRSDGLAEYCLPCTTSTRYHKEGPGQIKSRPVICDEDARYFAGFFDGEGCIAILRHATLVPPAVNLRYFMVITVTNTHQGIMEWLHQTFGGNIKRYKRTTQQPTHADAWKWTAMSQDAAHILRAVLPYLKVKYAQAEVALEFQDIVSSTLTRSYASRSGQRGRLPLSPEDVAVRQALADKLLAIRRNDKHYSEIV